MLIASQGGQVLASIDQGRTFRLLPGVPAMPLAAVAAADSVAVVAGLGGVQAVPLH